MKDIDLLVKNVPIIQMALEISYIDLKFLIYFIHFLFIYNPGKFWLIISVILNSFIFSCLFGTEFSCLRSGIDRDYDF